MTEMKELRRDESSIIDKDHGSISEVLKSARLFSTVLLLALIAFFRFIVFWIWAKVSAQFVLCYLLLSERKVKAQIKSRRLGWEEANLFSDDQYGSKPSKIFRSYFFIFVEGHSAEIRVSQKVFEKFKEVSDLEVYFFADLLGQPHVLLESDSKILKKIRTPFRILGGWITPIWFLFSNSHEVKHFNVLKQETKEEAEFVIWNQVIDSPAGPEGEWVDRKTHLVYLELDGQTFEFEVSKEIYDDAKATEKVYVRYMDGFFGSPPQMRPILFRGRAV